MLSETAPQMSSKNTFPGFCLTVYKKVRISERKKLKISDKLIPSNNTEKTHKTYI